MPLRPSAPYRLSFGQMRSVGSFGIRAWYDPLRKAAAQARAVLIAAAADRLKVSAEELDAVNGEIVHAATSRRISFGELTEAAAGLPLPEAPPFRSFAARWPLESLEEAFAEGIMVGHVMPEFTFTPEEIGHMIAYLNSVAAAAEN